MFAHGPFAVRLIFSANFGIHVFDDQKHVMLWRLFVVKCSHQFSLTVKVICRRVTQNDGKLAAFGVEACSDHVYH